MPIRLNGTEEDLLLAVQDRLRDKVQGLNEANCFVCDVEIPEGDLMQFSDLVCTVCAGNARFPQGFFAGGGTEQLNQQFDIAVTLLRRSKLDRPHEVRAAWFDKSRGLISVYKRQILTALLIDRSSGTTKPWEPMSGGNYMLRDQLSPSACTGPRQVNGIDFAGFTLTFSASFDWRLL